MVGGDVLEPRTGVWWDLNTCPVPAGVEPGSVRGCIESALHKQIGPHSKVIIYAMGNLEFISTDLLREISSSGIILIHAPYRGNDLKRFLREWTEWSELKPPPFNTMLISDDNTMADPDFFRPFGFTNFCVYPKGRRPVTLDDDLKDQKVFVKEFVWETLLDDNYDNTIVNKEDEPLCICDVCDDFLEECGELIFHLKSEKHRQEAEKEAQEDDRESRKRNPEVALFYEENKKQSLERVIIEDVD